MRPQGLKVITNPPNPWHTTRVDWVGEPPAAKLQVFEDASRGVLARNDSPDVSFKWSVNPYRGCHHGCAYCYARPSHQYLDFGAGTDFEKKLVVKKNAPRLLRDALNGRGWRGELIAFSGNTDCYQPLEAAYGLTRQCLEVCLEFRNPVGIITKGTLIERDIPLLRALHERAHCSVAISVPFFDPDHARKIEPYVASPARRFKTIEALAKAGVPVSVMIGPIIPGLNDEDIPAILEAARDAGARHCSRVLLRLPGAVSSVFAERLQAALPMRADKVLSQIGACREGQARSSDFGNRMVGEGPRWEVIEALFDNTARKLGFTRAPPVPSPSPYRRVEPQLSLF